MTLDAAHYSGQRNAHSDVVRAHDHLAHHDPWRGVDSKIIAAERRRRVMAEPAYLMTRRLLGRALVLLQDGPMDAEAFRDALGLDDDDRVAELARWCVAYPADTPSGWAVWTYEGVRRRADDARTG